MGCRARHPICNMFWIASAGADRVQVDLIAICFALKDVAPLDSTGASNRLFAGVEHRYRLDLTILDRPVLEGSRDVAVRIELVLTGSTGVVDITA